MRRIVGILGTWAVGIGAASSVFGQAPAPAPRDKPVARPRPATAPGQPAAAKARDAVDPVALAKTDQLLAEWQKQSAGVETLDAKFTRIDTSNVFGDKTKFEGRALLKAPDLACLDIQRVDRGGKKAFEERIICTGKEIWQYIGPDARTYVFPLGGNGQQAALQQGPLPFLFNTNAAKLKERYDLLLVQEDPRFYHVRIIPRLAIDRENFSKAILRLHKGTLLPDYLRLIAINGDMQDYQFTTVERNARVNDVNFEGKPWSGFKVIWNPPRNAQPQQNDRAGRPSLGDNQPAVGVKPRARGR